MAERLLTDASGTKRFYELNKLPMPEGYEKEQ